MKRRFAPALLFASCFATAHAATFNVTTTSDSGPGSLRDAVIQANANPGPDTITFGVTGTILVTGGQIAINGPLTISGPGADTLTVNGNASSRIFSIFENVPDVCATPGVDFPVSISGLTITNGRRTVDSGGGALYSEKTLTLTSVVVSNSRAKNGGGLNFQTRYPGQTLTITDSQFTNNIALPFPSSTTGTNGGGLLVSERCGTTAGAATITLLRSVFASNHNQPTQFLDSVGAGAHINSFADVTITDTRIVGNTIDPPTPPVANASYRGAGLSIVDAKTVTIQRTEITQNASDRNGGFRLVHNLVAPLSATITNSTLSGNIGISPPAGAGTVIGVSGNVALQIYNSTIAGNVVLSGSAVGINASVSGGFAPTLTMQSSIVSNPALAADIGLDPTVPLLTVDASRSLIGTTGPGVTVSGSGNLLGATPQLDALAFNGGLTRTQALLAGSPAIEAGSNPLVLTTDQRGSGFARIGLLTTDMGAYEAQPGVPTTVTVSSGSGQTTRVGTAFAQPLVALVKDSFGNVLPGVTVNWDAPASGASATSSGPPSTVTNGFGLATIGGNANSIFGAYVVTAQAGSASTSFNLTNAIAVAPGTSCAGNAATNADLVEHYYASILNRASDAGGKAFWTSESDRLCGLGADVQQTFVVMANAFFNTPEYLGRNRTDTQFVTDLYGTFFGRQPDAGGFSFWLGQLAQGNPRNNVMSSFLLAPEFEQTMSSVFQNPPARAETYLVLNLYGGLLRRLAETGGYQFWTAQFRAAQCDANPVQAVTATVDAVSSGFVASGEYVVRNTTNGQFVEDIYYALLQRGAELAGYGYWVGQLNGAFLTRAQERQQFLTTTEMQTQSAAIAAQGCLI